jgi:hypothetical protein
MRRAYVALGTWLLLLDTGVARSEGAGVPASRETQIEAVAVSGNTRTRRETLLELLPRRPPARFSEAELVEFERRIANLAIFDQVQVERRGTTLSIAVREKWTLIPNFQFASSRTLADSYALAGVTEYNAFGTGNQLALQVFHEQRGWGATVAFTEHPYRRKRWALDVSGRAATARVRFDTGSSWLSTQFGLAGGFTSPPWLSDHLAYRAGYYYSREQISDSVGSDLPPNSHALGTWMVFTWDDYHWADFTPRGVRAELNLSAGAFLGTPVPQSRHLAQVELVLAQPLGRYSVFTARSTGAVSSLGNAGFSQLIGSLAGVRGLEDGLLRNWLQTFGNFELRQALPLADRWALQGVLFSDVAAFQQIDASGTRGRTGSAWSVGVGARVIPTWLANVVLRLDLARLLSPNQTWFLQFGLNQYF